MKKLFTLVALAGFFSAKVAAQEMPKIPYDSTKKQVIYSEVVPLAGMTKEEMFDKAYIILGEIYNEVDKKIEKKDKAAGTMDLKCTTRVMLKDPKTKELVQEKLYIKYKLKISFKDGKYRYEFYDFHEDRGGFKYPIEKYYLKDPATVTAANRAEERLAYLDQDIKSVIKKLKDGMSGQKVEKKDEW
jgi:hypothetical protein